MTDEELLNGIKNLVKNNGFVADEEENVNFIYPVLALETKHHVTLKDGRNFHVMCAIDALGAAFKFHQDTVINSMCSNAEKPIRIEIKNGELYDCDPLMLYALHADLNKSTD